MSTLNKSLPKVSGIRFANSSRANGKTVVTMPLGGAIQPDPSYACWKQSSYVYGYQAQYRVRARLTPANELTTGSTTKTTAWKHIADSWDAKTSIDKLDKCLLPTKKTWFIYRNFAGEDFAEAGDYDKLEIDIRVRSFSSSKKQHGSWVTGTIVVKCEPTVTFPEIVAFHDGGIRFYLGLGGWTRGGSYLRLSSVMLASDPDRELIKKALAKGEYLSDKVDGIGDEDAGELPYAGFLGKNFNAAFKPGDAIRIEGVFETCDGVKVDVSGDYVIGGTVASVDTPIVETSIDADRGELTATVSKSNPDEDWDDVSAWLMCGDERIDPCTVTEGENESRAFTFMPPLDTEAELHVGIENDLKFSDTFGCGFVGSVPSRGRVMVNYTDGTHEQPEGGFYGPLLAVMNFDTDVSESASRPSETALPFGRDLPMAFVGSGLTNSASIKGSIDATPDSCIKTEPFSTLAEWRAFQRQQGVVLVRKPEGWWMHALCTNVSISQEDEYDETKEVSLTLEEVGIL